MDNKQHILKSYIKYRDEYIEKYGENQWWWISQYDGYSNEN